MVVEPALEIGQKRSTTGTAYDRLAQPASQVAALVLADGSIAKGLTRDAPMVRQRSFALGMQRFQCRQIRRWHVNLRVARPSEHANERKVQRDGQSMQPQASRAGDAMFGGAEAEYCDQLEVVESGWYVTQTPERRSPVLHRMVPAALVPSMRGHQSASTNGASRQCCFVG